MNAAHLVGDKTLHYRKDQLEGLGQQFCEGNMGVGYRHTGPKAVSKSFFA